MKMQEGKIGTLFNKVTLETVQVNITYQEMKLQGMPSGLGPEIELFHVSFERPYSEITYQSERRYSKCFNFRS